MQQKSSLLAESLHLLVLSSFAIAQPLFSLLSEYPEFFVARQSQPVDLILLALILCLGLPSLFVLATLTANAIGPRCYRGLHAAVVGLLTAAILLQVFKRTIPMPGVVLASLAVLAGIAGSTAYVRLRPVRTYLTFLSPVILLFPALFLLNSGISRVVFPEPLDIRFADIEATTPVVMVVLDELPLSSLMDEQERIDPLRFPNLARFADQSYWFRNATTVSDSTLLAVPAILSGLSPQVGETRLPMLSDYPENLFTLLGGSYRLKVVENGTRLSPETGFSGTPSERMRSLLSDLTVVYCHVLLPEDLSTIVPPIDQSWGDFGPAGSPQQPPALPDEPESFADFEHDTSDRATRFQEFIDSIESDDEPTFFFLHSMLPHTPWQYLPSGKQYSLRESAIPGTTRVDSGDGVFPAWGSDRSLVAEGYRRHILQTAFVDTLIGRLIGKLRDVGLYDRSLIVITADHGTSFRPNDFSRKVSETNYADIMWIPLLIKTPFQKEGFVSDRNVETIDILATVAAALGIDRPWPTEGDSALDPTLEERGDKTILSSRSQEFTFGPGIDPRRDSLRRKLEVVGSGSWDRLFAYGEYAGLVGRSVDEIGVTETDIEVELNGDVFFSNVDLDAPFLLTHITGRILNEAAPFSRGHLAIAVNDTIRSVTEFLPGTDGAGEFSTLVPESAFRTGPNDVAVFFIVEEDGSPHLERLLPESRLTYSLDPSSGEEALQASDGSSVPLVPNDALGYVRMDVNEEGQTVAISGWAVDRTEPKGATVLVFQNGNLVVSGTPRTPRADVTAVHPEWASLTPGFRFELPLARFGDPDVTEVRVFALSDRGTAAELFYVRDGWTFVFTPPPAG